MISLDSSEWDSIASSPGGTGALTAQLLHQAQSGNDEAYDELFHQLCHQFTVGAVAYVAVPHLACLARDLAAERRTRPLSIIGAVVAARAAYPDKAASLLDEWRPDYLAALSDALELSAESLRQTNLEASEAQELLATVAALHGLADLAMHLFSQGGVTDLSCPLCGEYIQYGGK